MTFGPQAKADEQVFSVAYIAGLALLPKLLRKEASAQQLRDAPEGFPLQQQQKQARAV